MTTQDTPKFTGTEMYRDPLGRFSVWHPSDWAEFEIKEGVPKARGKKTKARLTAAKKATEEQPLPVREGTGYAPNPDDPHTSFSVWVSPLPEKAEAEDLEELRQAVDEGLTALQDCAVEHTKDDALGNLLKFERVYEFTEDGQRRRRRGAAGPPTAAAGRGAPASARRLFTRAAGVDRRGREAAPDRDAGPPAALGALGAIFGQ